MAASSPNIIPPTNQINRIRPKKPLDNWSTREKLCLASAVYKIGDQNWVSVSRAIKPYADSNRPPDWFHQKNCVSQYYDMLEQLEQPKRKRGDRAETDAPSLQIMRKMTIERSEQLKKEVMEMQQEFKQLKADSEAIEAGLWDDQLEEEWDKIKAEQKVKEEDVTVEVTDTDQKDSKEAVLEKSLGVPSDLDDTTQDSVGENIDISGLTEEDGVPSGMTTSTPIVSSSSLDVSSKMPVASHLLSSLLQSNVKTANELHQLKMEQEQGNPSAPHQLQSGSSSLVSTPHPPQQQSLLKAQATQDLLKQMQSTTTTGAAAASTTSVAASITAATTATSTTFGSSTTAAPAAKPAAPLWEDVHHVPDIKPDLEDSHVDVTTEVVEETVGEDMDTSSLADSIETSQPADLVAKVEVEVEAGDSQMSCPPVEGVEEEVALGGKETVVKTEDKAEVVVEEEPKDSTTELDVEGLDSIKEEADKDSQDEEDLVLKRLPESLSSSVAETDFADTPLKTEPLSPTSSISSRISETGSKRGRRGRPKGGRSRVSSRKSYTDDEKKDDASSSKFSDVDLSEEDTRDTEDLLSGGLGASATGSLLSESFPNSPASLSICSDTEEEKSHKQWKKSIMHVWRAATTHKYANVFLHRVTDDIAPGYKSVVLRPMDLSTIKKNVETGAIRATVEFQRDLMLMFSNAIMYNSSDHNVYRMATEMYDDVMQHIEIMVQTTDAKSLRQCRRADASDKEEDTKKRRHSVDQAEGGKTKKRKTRLDETLP